MRVALLTGGNDKPYALGLLGALVSQDISVDFIGDDDMGIAEIVADKRVNFLNYCGNQSSMASTSRKIIRVLNYYARLIGYASKSGSEIFHILWFNKFVWFDMFLLNSYYKVLRKKLVYTAHNVDERERDGGNNFLSRVSLWVFYRMVDHIFVHTLKMKRQLVRDFKVAETKISVIPFGINNTLPKSNLTRIEARDKLDLSIENKAVLFFGHIAPYKGLEYTLYALDCLRKKDDNYRLIIAGQIKKCRSYWFSLERIIKQLNLSKHLIKAIEYIPDEEVEIYFKASDVLLLPYRFIYQSGVLFLSYSFGLPVIATDVGSLRDDIVEGVTGMVCRAEDPSDLANTISTYFNSDLFRNLERNRNAVMDYANTTYSWDVVGEIVVRAYKDLTSKLEEAV